MYFISDTYNEAIRATTRRDNIKGVIRFKDGTYQDITTSDIDEGSVCITHQCINGDELMFGAAIVGQLDISIRTNKSRYGFYGAVIELTYQVFTGVLWEDVPLGKYTVAEAEKTNTCVSIVAYDNMQLLDKSLGATVLRGTLFEILEQICDETGVEKGFTEQDIRDLPNGSAILQIDEKSGCNTYRDAIKVVCQLTGTFAKVDRTGNLQLGRFQSEVSSTLTKNDRYKLTVADYTCMYNSLSATGLKGTFVAVADEESLGLQMDIQDAPAWDYGTEEDLQNRTQILLDYLQTIIYTPSKITLPSNPTYDCGDRVLLQTDDGDVETLITSYEWKYHNQMNMTSSGINPNLVGRSSYEKRETNRLLEQKTAENKLAVYDFTNPTDILVSDVTHKQLGFCSFASESDTNGFFMASLKLTANVEDIVEEEEEQLTVPIKILDSAGTETVINDAEGNPLTFTATSKCVHRSIKEGKVKVTLTYLLNSIELDYHVVEQFTNGEHTISLFMPIPEISGNRLHDWKILIAVENGTVLVPEYGLKAVILGQGLGTGKAPWDGTLDLTDIVANMYPLGGGLSTQPVTSHGADILQKLPPSAIGSDVVSNVAIRSGLRVQSVSDFGNLDDKVTQQTVTFTRTNFVVKDGDGLKLKTSYTFIGHPSAVDKGQLMEIETQTNNLVSVQEIEVK